VNPKDRDPLGTYESILLKWISNKQYEKAQTGFICLRIGNERLSVSEKHFFSVKIVAIG
jgi:hypothetical protein